MNPRLVAPALAALLLAASLAACGDDTGPTGGSSATDTSSLTSARLKAHFERLVEAGRKNDRAASESLVLSMVPRREELRSVLKAGPEAEAFLKAYQGAVVETMQPLDPLASVTAGAKYSVISVRAATTEELAARNDGELFPRGMKRFAQTVAAAGRTWYMVEAREPGKPDPKTFTALTALADRFILVAMPWHALPPEQAPNEGAADAPK